MVDCTPSDCISINAMWSNQFPGIHLNGFDTTGSHAGTVSNDRHQILMAARSDGIAYFEIGTTPRSPRHPLVLQLAAVIGAQLTPVGRLFPLNPVGQTYISFDMATEFPRGAPQEEELELYVLVGYDSNLNSRLELSDDASSEISAISTWSFRVIGPAAYNARVAATRRLLSVQV